MRKSVKRHYGKLLILLMIPILIFSKESINVEASSNSNALLDMIKIGHGDEFVELPDFDPAISSYVYEIDPEFDGVLEFEVIRQNEDQIIVNDGPIELRYGSSERSIFVISPIDNGLQRYDIEFKRPNTSHLKNLYIEGFSFKNNVPFESDQYEYDVDVFVDTDINIEYETFNEHSQVEILGIDNLQEGLNEVKVEVRTPNADPVDYHLNVYTKPHLEIDFAGSRQEFVAPQSGLYKLELWGAQGGSLTENYQGGLGDYVSGVIRLEEGEAIYVYTGGSGSSGFNGGGLSIDDIYGGGATDVRKDGEGLEHRLLVAGGGGAASANNDGGNAGQPGEAGKGTNAGKGATQSQGGQTGGELGLGGSSNTALGGGGGYYGGGASSDSASGGGGGSSYIDPSVLHPEYNKNNENSNEGHGRVKITGYFDEYRPSPDLLSIRVDGKEIQGFDPNKVDYTIEIEGEAKSSVSFEYDKKHIDQTVVGNLSANLTSGDYTHRFVVTSADTNNTKTYNIHFKRKPSNKLASLSVEGHILDPSTFDPNIQSYTTTIGHPDDFNLKYTTFDKEASVTVRGNKPGEISATGGVVTLTVSRDGLADYTYSIIIHIQQSKDFQYTGGVQTYNLAPGTYKIEVWGAEGGNRGNASGGRGGYSKGVVRLIEGDELGVFVGGAGNSSARGYNGGGLSGTGGVYGGGASDVRVQDNNFNLYDRIIVAGGGGSVGARNKRGEAGGGSSGISATESFGSGGEGGTQSSAGYRGSFGYGGYGSTENNGRGGAGGGGWYGGGGVRADVSRDDDRGGGGGSGYVLTNSSYKPNGYEVNPMYHFREAETIAGNQSMPNPHVENGTMVGNEGHGYARITLMVPAKPADKTLSSLEVTHEGKAVEILQDFDPELDEYDVILEPDQVMVKINAVANDPLAQVIGTDTELEIQHIKDGPDQHTFTVMGQDGSIKTYYINFHRPASSYAYLDDLKLDGVTLEGFKPEELEYRIELPYDANRKVLIDWTRARPGQEIIGDGIVQSVVKGEPIVIKVIAENGVDFNEYKIYLDYEDTNLLKEISGDGFTTINRTELKDETEFDIKVNRAYPSIDISAIAWDEDAKVTIEGNGYLRPGRTTVITITVDHPRILENRVYTLNVLRSDDEDDQDTEYDFIYTGGMQKFIVPETGDYIIEAWGAEGGNRGNASGGRGGYSKGVVRLIVDDELGIFVGGAGNSSARGYNGGGLSGTGGVYGGGASDVRVQDNNFNLYDRIIVAGGGGSVGARNKRGEAGGGSSGISATQSYGSGGQGGTQSSAGNRGSFGVGGSGLAQYNGRGGAGGGGWYGGGGVTPDRSVDDDRGGGGGSGYVLTNSSYKPNGYDVNPMYHFREAESIAGNKTIPNKIGGYTTGNTGNGFVRITQLRIESKDNYLQRIDLEPNNLVLTPEFNEDTMTNERFKLHLSPEQAEIKIFGVPVDPRASVEGNGEYLIEAGTQEIELDVTAENGEERTYTIEVYRDKSSNQYPKDIKVVGLVPSLCSQSDAYCKFEPEFDVNNNTGQDVFRMTVPGRIEDVEFVPVLGHPFQETEGDGVVHLEDGKENEITISIKSEDGTNTSIYKFIIERDMNGNADLGKLIMHDPDIDLGFHQDTSEYYVSIPHTYEKVGDLDLEFEPYDRNPLAHAELLHEADDELVEGLNILEIEVTAANGSVKKKYRLFVYRELSENIFLEYLNVYPNNGHTPDELVPNFNKTIDKYFLMVNNNVDHVRIETEAEHELTDVNIMGVDEENVYALDVGTNTIEIETTAQDKQTTGTYEITIVRRASDNANIEDIFFDGVSVDGFDPRLTEQEIVIDSGINYPRITARLEAYELQQEGKASYQISGATTGFEVGDNVVYFKVTAESGAQKTYTVNFHRPISDNTKLKSISNNLLNIRFDKDTREYRAAIPYTEAQFSIDGIPEHRTSILSGNGKYTLTPGLNEIVLAVTAENGDVGNYTFKINMLKNTDASLKAVELSEGTLVPGFSPNVYEYDIDIPEGLPFINIEGIPKVVSTNVEGDGKHDLVVGDNEIILKTTADNGEELSYVFRMYRTKSKDASLKNLVVRQGALTEKFDPEKREYTVYVPNGTRRVEVVPTLNHPHATSLVLGNNGLVTGSNTVIVRVTSEDKEHTLDYTLNVIVQDPPSENTDLEMLKVFSDDGKKEHALTPRFTANTKYYTVDVANEIDTISVEATAKEGEIVSGLGNHKLKVGQNNIVVSIKAENGVINDYQIEVTRLLSTNTNLESLSISNIERAINFRPNVTSYRVDTFDSALRISAKTEHPNASYEIIDNKDLVTGERQDVIVRVTSEDGEHQKDYILDTYKLKSINNYLKHLEVEGYRFTNGFSPSRNAYSLRENVIHDVNQVKIKAEAQDPNATVTYDEIYTLSVGRNFVDIVVTAENGRTNTYTIEIIRDGSYVNNLESILVNQDPIVGFDKLDTVYNLEFEYEVDSVQIGYTKEHPRSRVTGAGLHHLRVGDNKIVISVTSENGEVKPYILNIRRKEINSAKIKDLSVGKYLMEQTFDKDRTEYDIFLNNEIEYLHDKESTHALRQNLFIELEDPGASYTIENNMDLQEGNNEVIIKVTSSSQDKEEIYTLNVFRYAYASNFLLDLNVDEGEITPEFDKFNHVYEVEVPADIETITLSGLADKGTTVSGFSEHELQMGINHLRVTVRPTGTNIPRTYHVLVNRSYSNSNDLLSLSVSIGNERYPLLEEFDKDKLEYNLADDIPVGTETIRIHTTTNGKQVIGDGNVRIVAGENTLEIKVISESGLEKVYTLNLNRLKSDNNYLTQLTPSVGRFTENFLMGKTEYELRLDSSVTTLSFSVSVEDKNATVSGHERLIVESDRSTRTIVVKAENGDIKEYVVRVIKDDTNNALLEKLEVNGYRFNRTFEPEVFSYDLVLPHSKRTLLPSDITAIAQDSNSVVIKPGTINVDTKVSQTYDIEVRAIDGLTRETYRINVIREQGKDARISEIEFGPHGRLDRVFNSSQYNYELEFTHGLSHFEPSVISKLVTVDDNATVHYSTREPIEIVEGEFAPFKITVTSEDKSDVKEYNFNITYRRSTDSRLASLEIEDSVLDKPFNPDTLEYRISVDENRTSLPINAVARDAKAEIVSKFDDIELSEKETTIEIVVESERGTRSTYKLTVVRELTRRTDLLDVTLTNANQAEFIPKFDNFYDTFRAEVTTDNVGLNITKGHPKQTYQLYDAFNNPVDYRNFDLETVGEHRFRLEVSSSFEEKEDYFFLITKMGDTNNNLGKLNVTNIDHDLGFNKETLEYEINVPNDLEKLELDYAPESSKAKAKVLGNERLVPGLNNVIIRVTSEMGVDKDYVIKVIKGASVDLYLNTISVSNKGTILTDSDATNGSFRPLFNRYYKDYTATIQNRFDTVVLEAVASGGEDVEITYTNSEDVEIEKAKTGGIEVDIQPGNNLFKIITKHKDSPETRTHTVNIVREKLSDVSLRELKLYDDIEENESKLVKLEPEFKPDVTSYTTKVLPTTNFLTVATVLQVPSGARVETFGNKYLVDGVNIVRVVVTSEDRTQMKVYEIEVTKDKSDVNTLDKLSAKVEGLKSYDFPIKDYEEERMVYEVGKDVDTIELSASPSDPIAKVVGTGIHALNYGDNELDIIVTAQNGDVKTYKVNIKRAYNNDLSSLSVSHGTLSPAFDPSITDYTVEVPEEVKEIEILAEAVNPNALVEGTGYHDLEIGHQVFVVRVKSTETSQKETTVTVIRKKSDNTFLEYLNIKEGALTPTFSKETKRYTTYISQEHEEINLEALLEHDLSTYEIKATDGQIERTDKTGNMLSDAIKITNLSKDTNIVTFTVTAASGKTENYILTIYRQDKARFSNRLTDLKIKGLTPTEHQLELNPAFDPDETVYIVSVGEDVTSINISATRESQDAEILGGLGNHDLVPGANVFNIRVRSKDGIEKNYQIFIYKSASDDGSLSLVEFKEGFISPTFESHHLEYTLNVASNVSNLKDYKILPNQAGTTWTIKGEKNLKYGDDNLVSIETTSPNGTKGLVYKIRVNRDDNVSLYLDSLTSNVGKFTEEFDKTKLHYTLEVSGNTNSVMFNAVAEEKDAVSKISNNNTVISLSGMDERRVEFKVEGHNGKSITYRVDIKKNYDENAYLTHLWINPGTLVPEFNSDTFMYEVHVDYLVETIEIKANTNIDAQIVGLGTKALQFGENEFTISIMTNDGTIVNTYKIKVIREAISSSKILDLTFEEIDIIGFDKDMTSYQVDVSHGVEKLTIKDIVLEDPINSTYEISQTPSSFVTGVNNKVEIVVTNNKTEESTTYTFTVNSQMYVNNLLKSLSVKDFIDQSIIYPLDPVFEANTHRYEVKVPYATESVGVWAEADGNNAGIFGGNGGEIKLEVGDNSHTVTASESWIERKYVINIIREGNPDNTLKEVNLSAGILSPELSDEITNYTIKVGSEVSSIDIEGIANSEDAEVIGNETIKLDKAKTIHNIIVNAQNGDVRTYRFTIEKTVSSEHGVEDIQPTNENFTLDFSEETVEYDLRVDDSVFELGFIVATKDEHAIVSGHEVRDLAEGENIFEIIVKSQDGLNEVTYTITVIKETRVQNMTINPSSVVLGVGDVYEDLSVTLTPNNATNKDLVYESGDEDIVTVNQEGHISGVKQGSTTVTVSSVSNPDITKEIAVEVLLLELEVDSSVDYRPGFENRVEIDRVSLLEEEPYSDGEYDITGYVIGTYPGTSIETFKKAFKNKASLIKIYDSQDEEIIENDKFVGTHMTIRLVANEKIYDELMIFVRGDGNGDGAVNIADVGYLNNFILNLPSLEDQDYYEKALINIFLDLNSDGAANIADIGFINNHLLNPDNYDLNRKRDNEYE